MAKTANLYARIDPEIKARAEEILEALGMSSSGAINMFYKQIILNNGLPFEVKLPSHPLDISAMTEEQLNSELELGYADMQNGKVKSVDEVFSKFHKGDSI